MPIRRIQGYVRPLHMQKDYIFSLLSYFIISQEIGIECCCKGFQIASLCSIFDRVPRGSGADVLEMIPTICCLGCGHSLMHHQYSAGSLQSPSLFARMSLTLNSYSQLPFSLIQTVNGGCILLCSQGKDTSLLAVTATEHGPSAVVFRKHFSCTGDHGSERCSSDRLRNRPVDAKVDVSLKSKKLKANRTSGERAAVRRSTRLEEKRVRNTSEELSGTVASGSESKGSDYVEASFQSSLSEAVSQLIASLQTMDSFYSWTLPEVYGEEHSFAFYISSL